VPTEMGGQELHLPTMREDPLCRKFAGLSGLNRRGDSIGMVGNRKGIVGGVDSMEMFGVNQVVNSRVYDMVSTTGFNRRVRYYRDRRCEISQKYFALFELYLDSVYVGAWSLRGLDVVSVEDF
jgi:hypothetical protein